MHLATRDERGLSQSIQYAVILPGLMLVTLGIIQTGVWIHGHNVAIRSANAAADAARGSYGTTADAQSIGKKLAASGGLTNVNVTVTKGPTRVDITVSARAPLFFDVGLGQITETASVPVERAAQP
jgi:Flp pilus assembly protein TadG